jgi:hypothetical protein
MICELVAKAKEEGHDSAAALAFKIQHAFNRYLRTTRPPDQEVVFTFCKAGECDEPGSTLSATNVTINGMKGINIGAFSFHGGMTDLSNCTITMAGPGGYGIASQSEGRLSDNVAMVTTVSATNTPITVAGDTNDIVAAYFPKRRRLLLTLLLWHQAPTITR